jgi:small-conductance mechanosensitive channel
MQWWKSTSAWVELNIGIDASWFERLLLTWLVLVVYALGTRALARLLNKRFDDPTRRHLAAKTSSYILRLASLLALAAIWLGSASGIVAYLGVLSAGFAIALQDPLANLAGWLFITMRKPFEVGDRIEIGEHRGDVIDRQLFEFTLLEIGNWVGAEQSTGRLLYIPNGWVFKQSLANYTQGFSYVWHEIAVTFTFESNRTKARGILQKIADERADIDGSEAAKQLEQVADDTLLFFKNTTPIIWTSVADSGVTYTLRFLCNPRRRRSTESSIWDEILTALDGADDVDLAYPTSRLFNNATEGKRGARASD